MLDQGSSEVLHQDLTVLGWWSTLSKALWPETDLFLRASTLVSSCRIPVVCSANSGLRKFCCAEPRATNGIHDV